MEDTRNLVDEFYDEIKDKINLQRKGLHLSFKQVRSTISQSRYLYLIGINRACVIRISDHPGLITERRTQWETHRKEVKGFNLLTRTYFNKDFIHYEINEIDQLVSDVLEYMSV